MMPRRMGDLTGQRFGKLTVLSYAGQTNGYQKVWLCKCDCGVVKEVRQQHLVSGHTTTCGCGKYQLDDYTGRTFGFLTVVRRVEDYVCPGNGKHYVRYECRCVCGKMTVVNALNLRNGSTISCGCQKPVGVFQDLTGQRFGHLTVLCRVDDYVNGSGRKLIRYKCKCDCGNVIYVLANALRNGDTGSCGCVLRSRGEMAVRDWLDKQAIPYVLHKTFDGCLSDKGHKLSYDFWLPTFSALIECNGVQHYEAVDFFGGEKRFIIQRRHDDLKKIFADENGYSYLVIDCCDVNAIPFDVLLRNFISQIDC